MDSIHKWEYVELVDLLPQGSSHDAAMPDVGSQRFFLFPGLEVVHPRKKQLTNILDWTKCFVVYMAAMAQKFPAEIPEMLAYQLVIIQASQQYDGNYWRAYDTHFRVNAATSGNRLWSRIDPNLYTRFFTGRARELHWCEHCDSTSHASESCPLYSDNRGGKRPASQAEAAPAKRKNWPSDVCYKFNSSGCDRKNLHEVTCRAENPVT